VTKQQRIISLGVLGVLVLAVVWTLLPFRFADTLSCGPALFGGNPGEFNDRGRSLINPERDCHNAAKSRLTVAAVASLIAVLAGAAALAFQPISRHCVAGSHEDCVDWWPAALGPLGQSLGCQCECHD
jgi:hypothetical protein